jgi:putative acetyltransferase
VGTTSANNPRVATCGARDKAPCEAKRLAASVTGYETGQRLVLTEVRTTVKSGNVGITWATSPGQLAEVRGLFLEYAQSLGFSLCFQGFDQELAGLPGTYAPPQGRLLLATVVNQAAGCAGLHTLENDVCEMKRLYVRPQFRGSGLGRRLAATTIAEARGIGYKKMRLDTIVGKMDRAIELYRQLGFREIDPYRPNPIPGALYMELTL